MCLWTASTLKVYYFQLEVAVWSDMHSKHPCGVFIHWTAGLDHCQLTSENFEWRWLIFFISTLTQNVTTILSAEPESVRSVTF